MQAESSAWSPYLVGTLIGLLSIDLLFFQQAAERVVVDVFVIVGLLWCAGLGAAGRIFSTHRPV